MKSEDINMNKFLTPICLFHRHHPKLPFYKWPWTRSAYQILESFSCLNQSKPVTLMLVTDVGDQMCWWQVWDVGDRFRMLVTDSGCWWPIWYIEIITNITKKVANIMILPPTSQISHHHKVTNITVTLAGRHNCSWNSIPIMMLCFVFLKDQSIK